MTKLIEIWNDYLDDFKKYKKKVIKKTKKYFRKLKYRWNNPKNKYIALIIGFIKKISKNIKEVFLIIKEYLLSAKHRKQNLTVIGTLIGVNTLALALLLSTSTYAIYQGESEYSILGAKVGNLYTNNYDYTLLVYVEDTNDTGVGSGTYKITSSIPDMGYTYSGYKCLNDSTLIYDDETKITTVTTNQKEVCSIYFDLTNNVDIAVKILLEDDIDSNTYTSYDEIPYYGYKYSHYECSNNSELTYTSETHSISLSTSNKEYCSIYFQKISEDIDITLYIMDSDNTYNVFSSIPSNIVYVLNESNSFCTNNLGERVEDITYKDGYIEVNSDNITTCDIYLDINNE